MSFLGLSLEDGSMLLLSALTLSLALRRLLGWDGIRCLVNYVALATVSCLWLAFFQRSANVVFSLELAAAVGIGASGHGRLPLGSLCRVRQRPQPRRLRHLLEQEAPPVDLPCNRRQPRLLIDEREQSSRELSIARSIEAPPQELYSQENRRRLHDVA